MINIAHRLNGLTLYRRGPGGVVNCRNLPFGGRASETQGCIFQGRKMHGSHHQCLFEENVRKTNKGLYEF